MIRGNFMCGRYYIDEEIEDVISRLVREIDGRQGAVREGDIRPSESAPVVCVREGRLCAARMRWGLFGKDRKLLINARAETALARPTFSESVLHRRCIIPARHFYEWDREKQKVTFRNPSREPVYMAGFYRLYEDGLRFIILTTAANASVGPVHERMPLILKERDIRPWIEEESKVRHFLAQSSPMLERVQDFRQISLF